MKLWGRLRRSQPVERSPLLRCSFCTRSQRHVAKLVAGPGVQICSECVDICNSLLTYCDPPREDQPITQLPRLRCSFCSKSQRHVERLIAGPDVQICSECVGICNSVLATDADSGPAALAETSESHADSRSTPIWCSLCGTQVSVGNLLALRGGDSVCNQCVAIPETLRRMTPEL